MVLGCVRVCDCLLNLAMEFETSIGPADLAWPVLFKEEEEENHANDRPCQTALRQS